MYHLILRSKQALCSSPYTELYRPLLHNIFLSFYLFSLLNTLSCKISHSICSSVMLQKMSEGNSSSRLFGINLQIVITINNQLLMTRSSNSGFNSCCYHPPPAPTEQPPGQSRPFWPGGGKFFKQSCPIGTRGGGGGGGQV